MKPTVLHISTITTLKEKSEITNLNKFNKAFVYIPSIGGREYGEEGKE